MVRATGPLPTLTGLRVVFVAVLMAVTVPDLLSAT
jgi:hypothetical protein